MFGVFDILYVLLYSFVFSMGVKVVNGEGLSVFAALIFGVAGTIASTIGFSIGLILAGYPGLLVAAIFVVACMAIITKKLIGLKINQAFGICGTCTGLHTLLIFIFLSSEPAV